jgi:predicted phosphodiesterase
MASADSDRGVRRVAALYDIHGNLPALEAVLHEIRAAHVDLVVVGGDVLPGPMPRETMTLLMTLDIPTQFICGNGERVVAARLRGEAISEVPEVYHEVIDWTAQQLEPGQQHALMHWPPLCRIDVTGLGTVLFCHATPRNDSEVFTRNTPADRLVPVFAGTQEAVIVCGHTHMQFDRRAAAKRIVNAGSIGAPFAEPSGAYWLMLGPDVQLRRTGYDFEKAAEQVRATGFPQSESLVVRYILTPPTEAETLRTYASVELG